MYNTNKLNIWCRKHVLNAEKKSYKQHNDIIRMCLVPQGMRIIN